jgi:hypothetical protein
LSEYAKCEDCHKKMDLGNSCTMPYILIENKRLKRIPYKNPYKILYCHDCNVLLGQVHHYGCDMERCPNCKEQLFICNCTVMGVMTDKNSLPLKYENRKASLWESFKK